MHILRVRQCLRSCHLLDREKILRNTWNCVSLLQKHHSSVDSPEKDFFGVLAEESPDQSLDTADAIVNKEELYKKHLPEKVDKISDLSHDKVFQVPFGTIRLDSFNKPLRKKVRQRGDVNREKNSRFDEIYSQIENHDSSFQNLDISIDKNNVEFGYIDNQYFSPVEDGPELPQGLMDTHHKESSPSDNHVKERNIKYNLDPKCEETDEFTSTENFIDSQYFDERTSVTSYQPSPGPSVYRRHSLTESEDNLNHIDEQYFGLNKTNNETPLTFKENMESVESIKKEKENLEMHKRKGSDTRDEPETAFDAAMKIRKNLKNKNTQDLNGPLLDSKGFRILKDQVADLSKLTSYEIVNHIRTKVIYNENDIVAINKPYGLSSHGGPGINISLADILPELAGKIYHRGNLHLVHRLDKGTTGVILLAKTAEMATILHKMFQEQKVIKKYWALTKGVPNPRNGIIDIPIAEGTVEGKTRMVLKPDYDEKTRLVMKKSSVKRLEAITQYRVLSDSFQSALVECQPQTGIKHQLRVHLAFGLNTPIIGDHKYSHINKLAPQRLYPEILQRLHVRQSKVRFIPMHLHAKMVILPELLDGRNLFIKADLPYHFRKNMNSLKLKVGK
ncbi:uncharacterized protein LOC115213410 [Argonauta hians]